MSLFLAFHEEFLAHPAFRANLDRLYDFRAAELDFQSDEIRTIYQILQGNDAVHGYRKVVFLVAEDIQFGMLRMFSSIADPLHADFAVMRDRTEANIWLGLPSDF
ncbi:MAG: hypothetical protein O2967_13255 [Proteobacteria bacterium]|nr:hypothetical protein [Pseudomonadota bacterium]